MLRGMVAKPSVPSAGQPEDPGQAGLLRQGRDVLRALGERRLAREFCRRAGSAPDREALIAAFLDCIVRRRDR
ncbi:hypothetical protein K9F62_16790 [Desulfovibrio sp. JY]|nr:hypothetical protein K9F62_16790 [Desulfovibrio sp. JY]